MVGHHQNTQGGYCLLEFVVFPPLTFASKYSKCDDKETRLPLCMWVINQVVVF